MTKSSFTLGLLAVIVPLGLPAQRITPPHVSVRAGDGAFMLPIRFNQFAQSLLPITVHPVPPFPWAIDMLPAGSAAQIAIPTATPPGIYEIRANGQPLAAVSVDPPRPVDTPSPPVVVLNGWVFPCPSNDTFPIAAQLRNAGFTTLIFENCQQCRKCSIERLGDALAAFLNSQRDSTGAPIPAFDLVSHSMGGLIVRSYLAGKSETSATFRPPANHRIRKWISVATPNFGGHAALPSDNQTLQMTPGSTFLWDLATWNQGTDDVRGVDSLFLAGNAGAYTQPAVGLPPFGASDGAVSLTSASGAYFGLADERTRILPYCHADSVVVGNLFTCNTRQSIIFADTPQHMTFRIARSFFAGTDEWKTIGTTPSRDPIAPTRASLYLTARDASDVSLSNLSAGPSLPRSLVNPSVLGNDMLAAGDNNFSITSTAGTTAVTARLAGGAAHLLVNKPGPVIRSIRSLIPSSAPGIAVSSGSVITVTGSGFGTNAASAALTADGQALKIAAATDSEITAELPAQAAASHVRFRVVTASGQHTLGAYVTAPSTLPVITSVVNGASFQPGFASNSWVTITGYNLAPASRIWRGEEIVNGQLPASLDGVSVKINGLPAYVYFVSPNQLNVQAPTDENGAAARTVSVEVSTPFGTSRATGLKRTYAPALFQAGSTYAAAIDIDGSLVAAADAFPGAAARPARPGDIIAIYATGLGAGTNPVVPAGRVVSVPAPVTAEVTVSAGGVAAEVLFAGLVSPGLYQINVRVPELGAGNHAVSLRIGGVDSQNSPSIAVTR